MKTATRYVRDKTRTESVVVQLMTQDIQRIKTIAKQEKISYKNLLESIVHEYAQSA